MRRIIFAAILLVFAAVLFSACRTSGGNSGGPEIPAGTGNGGNAAPPRGTTPIGTWYEQNEDGDILEVTEKKISYIWTSYTGETYTDESALTITKNKDGYLLETKDEFFTFVDMSYDSAEDVIHAHTQPVMDGDGGYKPVEFRRTVYQAPPPPVYDPPEDNSDPDAQKSFDDMTIRSMHVSFYDGGAWNDPSSSMAPMEPYADSYSYDLSVLEDGSGLVSSSFCREIDIPKETVDELQQLVDEADLGSINGIDIHTDGMPYDTAEYELELELASGETIRSSANGPDVPEAWKNFQKPMHYLLYFAFRNAGYKNSSFHSTKPMKRVGTGTAPKPVDWRKWMEASELGWGYYEEEEEEPAETKAPLNVRYSSVRIEPDWKKSYDYSLYTEYLLFQGVEPARPALMKTLQDLNVEYKNRMESCLKEDYEMMEKVPSSVWKKADRLYCYSFCTVARGVDHGPFYYILLTEGHANSLGSGKYGWGYYPYHSYNIDVETGKILTAADLFTDKETAVQTILDYMQSSWGTHNEEGKFIHSDEFPAKLREFIDRTGPDSIRWDASYDYLELYFPQAMFTMSKNSIREVLYYDELQDVLGDRYTTVY